MCLYVCISMAVFVLEFVLFESSYIKHLSVKTNNSLRLLGLTIFWLIDLDWSKSSIFWHITPRSPLKTNGRFGGICHLHLHGRRIIKARDSACYLLQICFLLFRSWKLRWHVPPKRRLISNGLHCVKTQKPNRRFGGTCHLHLQGRRINQARFYAYY
jgi:hypothetical protein